MKCHPALQKSCMNLRTYLFVFNMFAAVLLGGSKAIEDLCRLQGNL